MAELYEKLAEIEHERWSDWMAYMFSLGEYDSDGYWIMPKGAEKRWNRQLATPYAELTEKEKDSDREQVDRYWQFIEAKDARIKALKKLLHLVLYSLDNEYKLKPSALYDKIKEALQNAEE